MADDLEQQVNAVFQPKAPVYCGTCGWYVPPLQRGNGWLPSRCLHPHAQQVMDTFEGRVRVSSLPEDRNKHNDCADWQRATFWSDLGHNTFKALMLVLAGFLLVYWGYQMLRALGLV